MHFASFGGKLFFLHLSVDLKCLPMEYWIDIRAQNNSSGGSNHPQVIREWKCSKLQHCAKSFTKGKKRTRVISPGAVQHWPRLCVSYILWLGRKTSHHFTEPAHSVFSLPYSASAGPILHFFSYACLLPPCQMQYDPFSGKSHYYSRSQKLTTVGPTKLPSNKSNFHLGQTHRKDWRGPVNWRSRGERFNLWIPARFSWTQILHLVPICFFDLATVNVNKKNAIIIIIFHMTKTPNPVANKRLLLKSKSYRLADPLSSWLASYHSGRSGVVSISGILSQPH